MDTELKFAEKYNWWTKKKDAISFETKLSYILTYGSSQELFFVFKNIDEKKLKTAFNAIKNDTFSLGTKRTAAIIQLLHYKHNKQI